MTRTEPRIAVVGGGISGLSAALELALSANGRADITLFESQTRTGGVIRTSEFAGLPVDEGADAFLRRVPDALQLAANVGMSELTSPTGASAAVWVEGLRSLPEGLLLGVPTSVRSLLRSRLVSPRGSARALADLVLPSRGLEHDSIGTWVRQRLGSEVHDRLIDALVGSIYAADTDRFSLATVPQLDALARGGRSAILTALRTRRPPSGEPIFAAPPTGMGSLTDAVARRIAELGVTVSIGTAVSEVAATERGVELDGQHFDAMILATPARVSERLLSSASPEAAAALGSIDAAGVIMVTLAVPAGSLPPTCAELSGYLVPKSRQRSVTAVSFASSKWAHLRPADGSQILRVSLGRDGLDMDDLDDDDTQTRVIDEVSSHLGCDVSPTATRITRWPGAFPQYRPHHGALVASIEGSLPQTIVAAGASLHGIGVPSCVASGRRAARTVLERLGLGHPPNGDPVRP